jgi:hypothetical protein
MEDEQGSKTMDNGPIPIDTNTRNHDFTEHSMEELRRDDEQVEKSSFLKSSEIGASTRAEPESWLLRLFESEFFDSRLGWFL